MSMNKADKRLLKATNELSRVRNELTAELGKVRMRIVDLKVERQALTSSPLSRQDLEDALRSDLAAAAKQAHSQVAPLLEEARTRPSARVEQIADPALYLPMPSKLSPELLALLLPVDMLMTAISPVLDSLDYFTAGPALPERQQRLAEIDGELATLEPEAAELAEALGVPATTAKPKPPGPKPGDTKGEPYRGHDGHWYQMTFARRQMPGDPNHTTEGFEAQRVPAPVKVKKAA